jgi:chaperonin GroEL
MPEPRILRGAAARAALLRGVDIMTRAVRPTLGPGARTVAVATMSRTAAPEILDSAATIARRTIQLARPFEDMGGMLVRQVVWTVFEATGDGGATAAVLCQGLLHATLPYIAADGDPIGLKRGIERGLMLALAELRRQARRIELPDDIAGVIAGSVRDPRVARMIGEALDAVGPDGVVLVQEGHGTTTDCEYLEGVQWDQGYSSYYLLPDGATSVTLVDPRIFVTDTTIETGEQLLPILEACAAAGERSLLIIAPSVTDTVVATLIVNRERGVFDAVMAVKAPASGDQQRHILDDLATITGGRCFHVAAGERFADVISEDLGRARRVWVTASAFGVLGGQGSKGAIRQRIAEAKLALRTVARDDALRETIQERIGKLAGAAAIIRVGAPTTTARAELKLRVEAAVTAGRAALRAGVVAGGGAAFLACVPALQVLAGQLPADEAHGVRALMRALAEPMRAIAENAGLAPAPIVHEAQERGGDWTFDVIRQTWVEAWEAGTVDPLPTALMALETSVSAATMALTTEVLLRCVRPAMAAKP